MYASYTWIQVILRIDRIDLLDFQRFTDAIRSKPPYFEYKYIYIDERIRPRILLRRQFGPG